MAPGDYPVSTDSQNYQAVAASKTAVLSGGGNGAKGDRLAGLLIIPATTSPGAVQIQDGSGSAITVFAGGSSSVSTLHSFPVPIGAYSTSGAWSVIAGANVSVLAFGNFT